MPYLAYNSRIKQIKKYGKCNGRAIDNKSSWKISAISGVLWLAIGIRHLIGKLYFFVVFFINFGVLIVLN